MTSCKKLALLAPMLVSAFGLLVFHVSEAWAYPKATTSYAISGIATEAACEKLGKDLTNWVPSYKCVQYPTVIARPVR